MARAFHAANLGWKPVPLWSWKLLLVGIVRSQRWLKTALLVGKTVTQGKRGRRPRRAY